MFRVENTSMLSRGGNEAALLRAEKLIRSTEKVCSDIVMLMYSEDLSKHLTNIVHVIQARILLR